MLVCENLFITFLMAARGLNPLIKYNVCLNQYHILFRPDCYPESHCFIWSSLLQFLNDTLASANVPVEIVDGFVGSISLSVPWSAILSENTQVEVHNLEITIQPRQREETAPGWCSLWVTKWIVLHYIHTEFKKEKGIGGGVVGVK